MQKVERDSTSASFSPICRIIFVAWRCCALREQGGHVVHSKAYVIVHLTRWKPHNGGKTESRYLRTSCCPLECNIMTWSVLMTSMDDFNSRLYSKPVASNHRDPSVHSSSALARDASCWSTLSSPSMNWYLDWAIIRAIYETFHISLHSKSSSDLSRFKLFVIGGLSLEYF